MLGGIRFVSGDLKRKLADYVDTWGSGRYAHGSIEHPILTGGSPDPGFVKPPSDR